MCSLRRWSTLLMLLLLVVMPSFSGAFAWALQQDAVDSSEEVTSGELQPSVAPSTETHSSDSRPELSTPFTRASPAPVSISPSAEYTSPQEQEATSDPVDAVETDGFVSVVSPKSSPPPVTPSYIGTGFQPPSVTSGINTGFQEPGPVTSLNVDTESQPSSVTSSDNGSQPPSVTLSDIDTGSREPTPVTSHVFNMTSILSTPHVTDGHYGDYSEDDTTFATDVSSEAAVSENDSDVLQSVVYHENCPQECLCFDLTVDCSNRDLFRVPEGLPAHLHILKLHGNQIGRVAQDDLSRLSQLRSVDLRRNGGIVLDREAFVDNRQLQEIDVSGCNLEALPPLDLPSGELSLKLVGNRIARLDMETLRLYSSVARLDLSNNKLKSLHNATFPVSPQLTHLILSSNQLSSIEPGCLSNLTSLQELQLFKNRLQQLHKDTFSGLAALIELDLSKNHLTTVGSLLFSGLNSLQVLKLRGNRIQQLQPGAFYQLPNMTTLMLDHNEIGNVSKSWLYGVSRLRVLTLSHNLIGDVTPDAWRHCDRLIRLDLAHNQLTAVTSHTFSWLPRLNFLLLAHNQLAAVEPSALSGCRQLRVLELDDNQLASTVEDSSGVFAGLQLLERLSLTGNHITSVGVGAMSGLSGLRELQLGSCPLSTLSLAAVEPLVSLQRLTLRSGQLLCDCELRWLAGWLRRRGLLGVDVVLSCAHPTSLRGRRLTQLQPDVDMLCSASPKPRISLQPRPQSTLRGANLSLSCQAETSANDTLQFRWLRDRRPLQLSGQQRIRVQNLATSFPDARSGSVMHSTLHVQELLDADAGVYQCVVTNSYGVSYSQPARVHVYVYPTFSVRPSDVQLAAGGTAVLECGAEGLPAPTVHWFKDGGAHFPAAVERRMNLMVSRHQFSISEVRADDQGVYTCTARSPAGQITANATLTVREAPSFVRSMSDVRVSAGETAVLECMSAGSPRPRLDWYKDGLPLVSTDRHFFTAGRQLLIVMQCQPEDAGLYGCQLTNELGDRRESAQLTVLPESGLSVSAGGVAAGSPYVLLVVPVLLGVLLTSLLWVLVFCQLRKRQLRRQRARAAASALSAGCPLLERVPRPPSPPAALVRASGATELLLASSAVQLYSDNGSEHSSGKDSGQGGHDEPVVALLAGVESDDEGVVGTPLVGRRRRVLTTFQGGGARTQRGSLQTVVPRHLYADRRLSQLTADQTAHRRSNGL